MFVKKDTVIGTKYDVMLWGFKCTLKDRRNGELAEGYIVVVGNDEYDLEEAQKEIRSRYGALGYTVAECVYDDTRVWCFDALQVYKEAKCSRCVGCENYIREDMSVGQQADCQAIIDQEEADSSDAVDAELVIAFRNSGKNCAYYDMKEGSKKAAEDKPDYLAEIMATLAELEESEGTEE